MNLLFISALVGGKYAGPTTSVPNQVFSQSKIDNVFWYNLTDIKCPMEKCNSIYHNINEYPSERLEDLPFPFSEPDLVIFEEFHKTKFIKFANQLKKKKIPYIIVPRSQLTKQYMMNKKLKKKLGNFIIFNRFIKSAKAIQYLSIKEESDSQEYNRGVEGFVIPNGIFTNPVKFDDEYKETFHGVFIGRYNIYQKGLDMLIEAVKELKNELINEKIYIDLYGPDERTGNRSDVEKLVNEAGISDIINVHGAAYEKEKQLILEKADFFVHTSRYEGMPMSVLEALSYGLPCVVTRGTNMTEEIDKYSAGWNCEDNVNSIVTALKKFIRDKSRLKQYSENALMLAKEYNWDKIAEMSHKIFLSYVE